MNTASPRIPDCTYRLQFNRDFTFADAQQITEYLHQLGISDAYASPYFQARAESMHGYDITDHNKLNAAIGSRADYDAWIRELHARQMGQVLDFVPNHMGIGEPLNTWWMDVLENGPSSIYARYFDIDWHPLKTDLHEKVLLPILGDQYGRVLERGELKVHHDSGSFHLCYYEKELPIAPGTYRYILELALENLAPYKNEEFYAEFQSILTALEYLPKRTETDPEKLEERIREKEIIKRRLERRMEDAPEVRKAIEDALETINGKPGDSASFDRLDELLNAQSYRLAFWRVAAEEINYRRFFDINDLAAIRMELPEVFDATHRLLLELVGGGAVSGLRIDHPDGLYLPREYFEQLQQRCADALKRPLPQDRRAIYLVVEKILTGNERLPKDWPVHGTTGYEFGTEVAQLLVDSSAETMMTNIYRRFIGHSMHFGHLVYAKKRQVMRLSLANDVSVLGNLADRLSEKNRWFRDFTLQTLARAVAEVIACFPVYRTYLAPGQPVSDEDRHVVERAIAAAKRRNPGIEASVFNFLRDILLFQFPENLDEATREEYTRFVLKFQQYTGPITAKGLEDTVFYIFNRLVALNEVGGEPQQFGISPAEFHERNKNRQRNWPHTLLATSTHDTKRSEDTRARMLAISEVPALWRSAVSKWRNNNRRLKGTVDESAAPDLNEEYLLYQTLLGTWPVQEDGRPAPQASADYIQRIQAYMTKALNEAKLNTSWIQPNEEWLTATTNFVAHILESSPKNKFLGNFLPVVEQVARLGAINSLTQTLLKLTSPGVPDIYQGNEVWDFSLVDPDNRRKVDYASRRRLLAETESADPARLLQRWPTGEIKMFLIRKLLQFRRSKPDLFRHGGYDPLPPVNAFADSCVAFIRAWNQEMAIIIAPRLSSRVGFPPVGEKWQDTAIGLPDWAAGRQLRDLFTGHKVSVSNSQVRLSDALAVVPFACLTSAN